MCLQYVSESHSQLHTKLISGFIYLFPSPAVSMTCIAKVTEQNTFISCTLSPLTMPIGITLKTFLIIPQIGLLISSWLLRVDVNVTN